MDINTLATIGIILSCTPSGRGLGGQIIILTARADVPVAVCIIAIESLTLATPNRTKTLDKLESLAKKGDNPQVMVLHGLILQKRGQKEEALEWFERAYSISKPKPEKPFLDFTLGGVISPPWAVYGSLKGSMGDKETAQKALEIGALEYGSPEALGLIAKGAKMSKDWDKFIKYTTIVAMSGNPDACFQLGTYYIKQFIGKFDGGQEKPKGLFTRLASFLLPPDTRESRLLGMEWLRIAAAYGDTRSSVVLAILLREDGNYRDGYQYLRAAEGDERLSAMATELRSLYRDKEAVFDVEQFLAN